MFRGKILFIVVPILTAALFLAGTLVLYTMNRVEYRAQPNLPPIAQGEVDPEVWGQHYPRHYDSYRAAVDLPIIRTKYGGNDPFSKLEKFPELLILYKGFGFAEEYNEERGHPFAVEDIEFIDPARKRAGAVCLTCKSADVPNLLAKYGDDFYTANFDAMMEEVNHAIACSDCHEPNTMDLVITRPALVSALDKMGVDVNRATRQEMRSLVCAQCHVEYYFTRGDQIVTFPWGDSVEGMKPEQAYEYFERGQYADNPFFDWIHPDSGTPLLKAQHPDYEFFVNSTHHAAGVSCADCHMPFIRQGNVKFTSHTWMSPLRTIPESCQVCHRQSEDYLQRRVEHIQDQNYELLKIAANTNVLAVEEITKSINTPNADPNLIAEAQELHRLSQWLWDWMSSENSMGFHNSAEGLNYLGKSIDYAHQAIRAAQRSRGLID